MSEKKLPTGYDKAWLKEENDRRSAAGLPPLQQRKRSAVERERLRALQNIVSPMAAADINPDYELIEVCPATRRPPRNRAERALDALFPSGIPDDSNRRLMAKVNAWLEAENLRPVDLRTVRRAAGRK
jgi:hypothetical protein